MKKKKKGFTLIEMVIVIALTVIIVTIAGSMMTTGNKIFSDSDVKTTLQIEGQDIQEKLSHIGMQAQKIISAEIKDDEVKSLIIKSYDKDENIKYFKIEIDGGKLSISKCKDSDGLVIESSEDISKNIKSFKIIYSGNLHETNNAEFIIKLGYGKGLTNVENYPIDFKVTFRNSGLKN